MEPFKALTIENTTYCQANCVVCVRNKINYSLESMVQQLFQKAVSEVADLYRGRGGELRFIDLGGMGEPLLDTQIETKLEWLEEHYPKIKVGLTTNAQLLMKKREIICRYVDVLKISHYGFTKKSFESVHRGSLIFEEVKNNIENFLSIPREQRPKVTMSFLKLAENNGEEDAWRNYWEDKCDELYIWLPHNWAGYKKSHTKQIKEKCISCGRPGSDFCVRANGDVSVCCFDFNRELIIGNLNESSFKEMYDGEKMKEIVKMHKCRTFFESENICQHCDQIYDRSDALIYSSNADYKINTRTTADYI